MYFIVDCYNAIFVPSDMPAWSKSTVLLLHQEHDCQELFQSVFQPQHRECHGFEGVFFMVVFTYFVFDFFFLIFDFFDLFYFCNFFWPVWEYNCCSYVLSWKSFSIYIYFLFQHFCNCPCISLKQKQGALIGKHYKICKLFFYVHFWLQK